MQIAVKSPGRIYIDAERPSDKSMKKNESQSLHGFGIFLWLLIVGT